MQAGYWLCIYIPIFLALYLALRTRRQAGFHHAALLRRRKGAPPVMETMIQTLLGKGVSVSTINETIQGKLIRYDQGWLTLADSRGKEQFVNADYVVKLKEIPIKY